MRSGTAGVRLSGPSGCCRYTQVEVYGLSVESSLLLCILPPAPTPRTCSCAPRPILHPGAYVRVGRVPRV